MKIAHIGSRGIPARYSGVEKSIEESSKRLIEQGFEISVYCHSKKTTPSYCNGIKLIPLPTINTKHLTTMVHSFLSTIHVIFTNADIIHYHCLGPSVFSFVPRFFGKKTIVTIHALDWKRKKWNPLVRYLLKFCEIPAVYFPDKTIVVSKYLQNYFEHKYNKKTCFIPNGINTANESSCTGAGNYILFVGRLVPEKGLDYLIKAFNEINTEKELWIAGESSYTNRYVERLKEMSGPKIKFLGSVYDKEDLDNLYKNCYLFVLPSEVEGCPPLTLLEAMSFGKCCVVSDIPECRENIFECTVNFQNKAYKDLKSILERLLNNPQEVEQMGKKALIMTRESYDWNKIVPGLKNIYSSDALLCNRKKPLNR